MMAVEWLTATHPNAVILTEYPIKNGGKKGAINGSADIVMILNGIMYMWEVKSGKTGIDEREAFDEVSNYVAAEQRIQSAPGGGNLRVWPGGEIPQLVGPDPVDPKRYLVAQSMSLKTPWRQRGAPVNIMKASGVVSWWDRSGSKPGEPDFVPVPATVPSTVWTLDQSTVDDIATGIGIAAGFLAGAATMGTAN